MIFNTLDFIKIHRNDNKNLIYDPVFYIFLKINN